MKISTTPLIPAVIFALTYTGCASWGTTDVYGSRTVLSQTPLGSPQFVESDTYTTETNERDISRQRRDGRIVTRRQSTTNHTRTTRSHCMQEVSFDYLQPFERVPDVENRGVDWFIGIVLALAGGSVISAGALEQNSVFQPGDPLYERPPEMSTFYAIGGSLLAGGVAWVAGSYIKTALSDPPAVTQHEQRWSETSFVEAQGCR